MLTLEQLRRFAKTRNKSGAFQSNLQFQIDANSCGFSVEDLGPVRVFKIDGFKGYKWYPDTKDGKVQVVEFGRTVYIGDDDDADSRSMFELMLTAQYEPEASAA